MNSDALTRQAIRLAQRESSKRGRTLTREEVLRLHVQTVEPWKRAFAALIGFCAIGFAAACYFMGAPWWIWIPFGLGGIVVVLVGIVGKKEYLDRELRKLREDGPTRIADSILNALI